jgi:hypothetical protein
MTTPAEGKTFAKQVVDMYAEGRSDAEVAAELKITIKDYYKQIGESATFAQLVEFGRTLSQAFWESQYRKNLGNKNFNTALLNFYMKNKYGWADKTETTNSNENVNTDLDSLRTQVNAQVERFIKQNTPELTDAKRMLTIVKDNTERDE